MHETTFRKAAESAGLNPYQAEIANIREQSSWVHQQQQEAATNKAIETIRTIVAKVHYNQSLIATLPAAGQARAGHRRRHRRDCRRPWTSPSAGYPVVLVERADHLGGRMAELSGLYLNFDGSADLLQHKIEAVLTHPNIQVLTGSEVASVGGYVGNFTVQVEQRRRAGARRLRGSGSPSTSARSSSRPATTCTTSRSWVSTVAGATPT